MASTSISRTGAFGSAIRGGATRTAPMQVAKAPAVSTCRTFACDFATTSRVTLETPLQSSRASRAAPPSVSFSVARSSHKLTPSPFAAHRAGLATEAKAQPTPAPEITRRPTEPEDPEVYTDGDPSLIITDRAAKHLSKVSARENNDKLALRVAVEPGGCHGYQYKMELTDEVEEDDFRFSIGDRVHLVVDSTSLRLIKGSTIDYVTELIGSQFAIFHNPQAKGAGCGCGVSWEPNL